MVKVYRLRIIDCYLSRAFNANTLTLNCSIKTPGGGLWSATRPRKLQWFILLQGWCNFYEDRLSAQNSKKGLYFISNVLMCRL